MKILAVLLLAILALVEGGFYGGFPSYVFSEGLDPSFQSGRDPRQDRGPVSFPPAPPDNGETSGVVPGASGYGFVPASNSQPGFHRPFYF